MITRTPNEKAAMATVPAGILYVVATPIGNLGDLSARGREVLSQVAAIVMAP